jgi:tetratricopeptide (TPR) repeat protein
MKAHHNRLTLPLALLGIAIVTVLAYYPGMSAGFYFDDEQNLLDAVALHWDELSVSNVLHAFQEAHLHTRPVANLSMALNHLASGVDPAPYHWTNLAIHLAVGLALFWVITLFQRNHGAGPVDRTIALLAVLLFLVHPLNIQATTYVVQRMTSLATLFLLLTLGCYISGRCSAITGRRWRWFLLGSACLLFASGSKEIGFLVVPLLILYELCFNGAAWRAAYERAADRLGLPLLVLAVSMVLLPPGWLAWSFAADHLYWNETMPFRDFSGVERMLTQGRVQIFYLSLLLWPAPSRLNLDHEFTVSRSLFDPITTLLAIVLIAVTIVLALRSVRTRPLLAFPVLGYWLLHTMEAGPLNLELVFEHRMYLPMTMLALLLALNARLAAGRKAITGYSVVLVAAASLAVSTYYRNIVWGDPMGFHRDVAQKSPGKFRPQYNLGTELGQHGMLDEARLALEKAIRIWPESSAAHNQLGNVYLMTSQPRLAEHHYRLAVKNDSWNAEALFNLASVLMSQGRHQEQREILEQFIQVAPPYLDEQKQWALQQLGR